MPKDTVYEPSQRCPGCEGFLYNAKKYDYPARPEYMVNGKRPMRYFSEMLVCINCGRLWTLENDDIYLYPQGIPGRTFKKRY